MDLSLFFLLIFLMLFYCFYLVYKQKEIITNEQAYHLGNRSLSATSLSLTLLATQVGAGSIIGVSKKMLSSNYFVACALQTMVLYTTVQNLDFFIFKIIIANCCEFIYLLFWGA